MKPGALLTDSARALNRHRLRSSFIMLGSAVGVAALVFVLTLGQGARRKMLTTVRQIFGDSSIVVVTGGQQLIGGPRPGAARLTIDDIAAVADAVPEVELWDPQQMLTASLRHGNASAPSRVLGQSERSERVWSRRVSRGRYFDSSAVRRMERVALIGETVARNLFDRADPIGGELLIDAVPFTVIGVLERFGTDLHGMDRDNEVVVPVSTFQRRLANVDTIGIAKLLLRDTSHLERTVAQVRTALRARHALDAGQPDDFQLLSPIEVRAMMGKMQSVLTLYLPLASVVVLLVGGIVAAALMLGSVNARIGEIGLRRAVGARPQDIAWLFVAETAVTTLGGGSLGVLLGMAGARALANHLKMGPVFSWTAVLVGLALAIATGALAGVLPARRAARLAPAEALR
jgi:putative ABC transport system permease protein